MGPFQHRPEGLDAVGVRLSAHVFAHAMVDGLVLEGNPLIACRGVRIDRGARYRAFLHEGLHGALVHILDNRGADLIGVAVLGADHRRFASRPAAALIILAPLVAPVAFAPAHESLVHLDGPDKRKLLLYPRLADTLQHEPGGRLGNTDVPVEFHAADGLQAGEFQVDGYGPLAKFDV